MKDNLVYESECLSLNFNLLEDFGCLDFFRKHDDSFIVKIDFELYKSFELTQEQHSQIFDYISQSEQSSLLDSVEFKMMHLIHYDAYVIVPKKQNILTIYVPEEEIQHVIGSRGSNINSLCFMHGYKKINVIPTGVK